MARERERSGTHVLQVNVSPDDFFVDLGVELEELKQILEEPQPVLNVDNKRGGGGSANEMDEARTINRENESHSSASSTLNFDTVRESISKVTQVPSTTVAGAAIGAITGGIIAGPLGAAAGKFQKPIYLCLCRSDPCLTRCVSFLFH